MQQIGNNFHLFRREANKCQICYYAAAAADVQLSGKNKAVLSNVKIRIIRNTTDITFYARRVRRAVPMDWMA